MTGFEAWLAATVAADLYARAADKAFKADARQKVLAEARSSSHAVPRRVLKRWYDDDRTWTALIKCGPEPFDQLVDSLITFAGQGWRGRELPHDDAVGIVTAVVSNFLSCLPPSEAINAADKRSAIRDEQILESVTEGFADVQDRLGVQGDFPGRLLQLPPSPRSVLERVGPTTASVALVRIFEGEDPHRAFLDMTAPDLPDWLVQGSGDEVLAAAELCALYGAARGAAQLFRIAADRLPLKGYYLARSAVEYHQAGEPELGDETLELARQLSPNPQVEAIAAALAEDPNGVLVALDETAALEDPYLTQLRRTALTATGQRDAALEFARRAIELYPESAGLKLAIANALLQRSTAPSAIARSRDRSEALGFAMQARDSMRAWRLKSGEAVAVACQAHLLDGDLIAARRLAMAAPHGEAQPEEAMDLAVLEVLTQILFQDDDLANLRELIHSTVTNPFTRAMMEAQIAERARTDADDLQRLYDAAWSVASDEHDKRQYWITAATAGVTVHGLAEMDEIVSELEDLADLVHGSVFLNQGEPAKAVERLRQGRRTVPTAHLLATALVAAGQLNDAVNVLRDAADRFGSVQFLERAARLLLADQQYADAVEIAESGLASSPGSATVTRRTFHEILVSAAEQQQSWSTAISRARTWVNDLGREPEARWSLAFAHQASGDVGSAWAELSAPPPLTPASASQARLYVLALGHEAPSPEAAKEVIDLVDRYDDDDLGELAAAVFFTKGSDAWGDVDPAIISRFQELLTEHAVPYEEDGDALLRVLSGSPEEMLAALRPQMEATARAGRSAAEQVASGHPYGYLASMTGRPYASTLLHRSAGCLPVSSLDPSTEMIELDAARAALSSSTVIDTSTVVVAEGLREFWPRLQASFARLVIPTHLMRDARAMVAAHARPATESLHFDPTIEAMSLVEHDLGLDARLRERGQWIADELDGLTHQDVGDTFRVADVGIPLDDMPWLSGIKLATTDGLPFWCDDLGLRQLAREEGVVAFGTTALLKALAETGALTPGDLTTAGRLLREEAAVDLPIDQEWMMLSSAASSGDAGAAALVFTRPAIWRLQTAQGLWDSLATAAVAHDPRKVVGWVEAAAVGLMRALPEGPAQAACAAIALQGVNVANFDAGAIAGCAARLGYRAADANKADPRPLFLAALHSALIDLYGTHEAATRMLEPDYDSESRRIVRRMVLGLRPEDA